MAIYRKFDKFPDALYCAIQLNDKKTIMDIFNSCPDVLVPVFVWFWSLCFVVFVL